MVDVPLGIDTIQELLSEEELKILIPQYKKEYRSNEDLELIPIESKLLNYRMNHIREEQQVRFDYDVLFVTVGQSVGPMFLTINFVRPKRVCMIATDGSRNIADKVRSLIENQAGGTSVVFDIEEVEGTDIVSLYKVVNDYIQKYKKKNFTKFGIDATAGKKSMSSGAALAADFFEIDLLYLDTVSKEKGFYPATQILKVLERPENVLGDRRIMILIDLINRGHFRSAIDFSETLLTLQRSHYETLYAEF